MGETGNTPARARRYCEGGDREPNDRRRIRARGCSGGYAEGTLDRLSAVLRDLGLLLCLVRPSFEGADRALCTALGQRNHVRAVECSKCPGLLHLGVAGKVL